MNFVIITHVPHIVSNSDYYAYAPYVHEMNIWTKFVDKLTIVAPLADVSLQKSAIDAKYDHESIEYIAIKNFDILSFKSTIKTVLKIPKISWTLFKAMRNADHIHLRCPGNIGLLACSIQIFFPNKPKTVKYAGNWDPNSPQPFTYKLQQWILNNTFLTKNCNVLVYGRWIGMSKNIKPFFTATYLERDKLPPQQITISSSKIKFIFAGMLVAGKRPLYAVKLVEALLKNDFDVELDFYGDGNLRAEMEEYIFKHQLQDRIKLLGNQEKYILKTAFQQSHFVILPSASEGWPKVIAEGMFWGCVPIATSVSCLEWMLDHGKRGILLTMNLNDDVTLIKTILNNDAVFQNKRDLSAAWSQQYTLDVFENEVKKMLKVCE